MHNKKLSFSINDIFEITKGDFSGNKNGPVITGIMPLNKAEKNHVTIFDNPDYKHYLDNARPALIIVKSGLEKYIKDKTIPLIIHENPHSILPDLLKLFEKTPSLKGISSNAYIDPSSNIGQNTCIGDFTVIMNDSQIGDGCVILSNCTIGQDVQIGDNTVVYPGARVLNRCKIGSNVIIHSNTVIGSDGYGYYTTPEGVHRKIPQIGRVIIEDDVEIGSNVTVDRGTMDDTIIGEGTKIDNLVQIAHNVKIGKHCLIVSQVGISGSATIGDHVVIAGQAGIAGHLSIPSHTRIGGRSAVIGSIEKPGDYSGYPLLPLGDFLRNMSAMKRLHNLYQDLKKIKKILKI